MTDLISRADAIEAVKKVVIDNDVIEALKALPSADAVPTVIRAKTFMRKEDFDKWAEDIKKQNKSIVCIPCDAEVVSDDAVQGKWNKFDTGIYLCSNCNWAVGNEYNYCPCCGAKMERREP